ncbi:MAG: hypothetical protein IPP76_13190 [Moraxellaceae bacterium]|nr:hypothetical protein [Moraxellaceae bacterium]
MLMNKSIQIPPALAVIAAGRDFLTTAETAHALNRKDQTLRKWACLECGPVRPIRINSRLMWRVTDLAQLLNGESVANQAAHAKGAV